MSRSASTALLVAGYAAAVPFTLFTPGFRRLWRRREPWALAAAEGGAALICAGWAARGAVAPAVTNAAWLLGFGAVYAREGRRRARVGAASEGPGA